MTDNTPNSPLDRLAQDLGVIKQELIKIQKRLDAADTFTLKLLQTLKRSEETFDVRVARAQYNLFAGLTHSLEHSLDEYTRQVEARMRGFEVEVVDGKTVLENGSTIQVAKNAEGGYDYSPAAFPDEINNQGTEPFSKYFEDHPEIFGERTVLLVNVLSELPPKVPTPEVITDGEA